MEGQEKKHKEVADQEKGSPADFEGKTEDDAIPREVISKSDDPEMRTVPAYKPPHHYSENQRFVCQIRGIVDAGIDEQFASGKPVVFSDRICQEVGLEYSTLEALFFQIQDVPIKEYILTRKVEKVKEVLVYADCPLQEIARLLGFEGTARLSRELKKHTGYGPDHYIGIRQEKLSVISEAAKGKGAA